MVREYDAMQQHHMHPAHPAAALVRGDYDGMQHNVQQRPVAAHPAATLAREYDGMQHNVQQRPVAAHRAALAHEYDGMPHMHQAHPAALAREYDGMQHNVQQRPAAAHRAALAREYDGMQHMHEAAHPAALAPEYDGLQHNLQQRPAAAHPAALARDYYHDMQYQRQDGPAAALGQQHPIMMHPREQQYGAYYLPAGLPPRYPMYQHPYDNNGHLPYFDNNAHQMGNYHQRLQRGPAPHDMQQGRYQALLAVTNANSAAMASYMQGNNQQTQHNNNLASLNIAMSNNFNALQHAYDKF
jgi:hypothetical protein